MAVRTGAQLKTDQATADTALATAIATPTEANVTAWQTALTTVVVNGIDSIAIVKQPPATISTYNGNFPTQIPGTTQIQNIGRDVARLAVGARRGAIEVGRIAASLSMGIGTAADLAKELKRVQKGLEGGPWASYRNLSTTD